MTISLSTSRNLESHDAWSGADRFEYSTNALDKEITGSCCHCERRRNRFCVVLLSKIAAGSDPWVRKLNKQSSWSRIYVDLALIQVTLVQRMKQQGDIIDACFYRKRSLSSIMNKRSNMKPIIAIAVPHNYYKKVSNTIITAFSYNLTEMDMQFLKANHVISAEADIQQAVD